MPSTFTPAANPSSFRRIAAAMWNSPNDPTIYGFVDVDVSETLRFIEEFRAQSGLKITMTHLVAQAVASAFGRYPELNAKVRFSGRIEQRSSVDLVVSVATEGGRDLSAARVEGADKLSLRKMIDTIQEAVDKTRSGRDKDYEKSRGLVKKLPSWMVRPMLRLTDFVGNELDLHLPALGMPRDPFGTAVITNVGMFGIDTAFAPFVPLGRCPMLLLVTTVKERAWAEDGRVESRPVLRLCASFDHRIIDGFQAGRLADAICSYLRNPSEAQS